MTSDTVIDDQSSRPSGGLPVVQVFGGMGVSDNDGPLSIGGPRQRRLLALLTLRAGTTTSIDWLAEHLWSDDDRPDTPAPALRTYVSRLRQALPERARSWLTTQPAGYLFDAPAQALEHRRFADLRAEARQARERDDPLAALARLDAALALWRGEPFQELQDDDIARASIERLRLDRLEVQEERWESSLALGRHTQITGELGVFATEHRLRDRATRQYALALHRSGRTPEALHVIASHRAHLAEQSGLDPSPDVTALEQAMLRGDESLAVERVGQPLRGYRLLDEIGSGAFSIVWRGIQPSVGREVAIKQIRSELASQPEFIRRFEAEAHLIARIEHPHIVPIIDFWRDPESAYLVMRYLRGGTLERRLDDGPLPIRDALSLARQIGGALSAAHRHGIVHRDVKSANIMFDDTGNAFLGDFGIALEASDSAGSAAALSTGSPAYSAPEQIRREPLGPQADIFSLGVTIFECITGMLPFTKSGSLSDFIELQLYADFPRVTDLEPAVAHHVADAISKATAKAPADRFASVAEFIEALDPLAGDSSHQTTAEVATTLPNPYLGLSAFDEADRDNFFGREALVMTLLDRLKGTGLASRCVALVGPSGSGKSSVVRAGLSPAVRRGAVPGSEQWFATTMIPGIDPFESLEAALLRVAVNPPELLLEQMRDGPRGLLRCLRRCLDSDERTIYLVIDQFEEIFTSGNDRVAYDFLTALAVAVEDPQTPLRLVVTLRADYYDRPLSHPDFAPILDTCSANVTPLTASELERAMVEPAKRLGVSFEPGLIALILADCIGQLAPLPMLQYALSELFERRNGASLTIDAYREMGRLTGALAGRAEAIHERAAETQQSAIRRIFGRLVNPGEETADLRRRVRIHDLGDDPNTAWALEQFGAARLITFDRDPASRLPTVEVAHEALLREWPRLATWLTEDRELLRSSEAVALAADEWATSGRSDADVFRGARLETALGLRTRAPERLRPIDAEFIAASADRAEVAQATEARGTRRLQQMLAGVGAALIVAMIAGGVAFSQRGRANEQAELAQTQAALADEQALVAQEAAAEAEVQAAVADEQTMLAQDAAAEAAAQAALADAQSELAVEAAARAEVATLISRSESIADSDEELSILLALEAYRRAPNSPAQQALARAFTSSTLVNRVSSLPPLVNFWQLGCTVWADAGGVNQFGQRGDQLVSQNLLTGVITDHGPAPAPCVSWIGSSGYDKRVALSVTGELFFASYDGPWELVNDLGSFPPVPTLLARLSGFNQAGRLIFSATDDGPTPAALIVDDSTGEIIGDPISGPGHLTELALSPDGSFGVVGFDGHSDESSVSGDSGVLLIIDAQTGVEVSRVDGITPVTYGFGTSGEVFVGTAEQTLVTVDMASGELTSTVATTARSRLVDVGVRNDGAIVVTSTDQAEIIDPEIGPTGEMVPLQRVVLAELRDDGQLFAVGAQGNRGEIYALDQAPTANNTIELPRRGNNIFADGSLAVIGPGGQPVVLVDLETGDQSQVALITMDGEPFDALFVAPEPDGFLAYSEDAQIGRWENGVMVDKIAPWGEGEVRAAVVHFGDDIMLLGVTGGEVGVFNTAAGELERTATIAASGIVDLITDEAGAIHIWSKTGVISSFGSDGVPIGEIETGLQTGPGFLSGAAVTERHLAFGSGDGGVIVDRVTGEVTRLPQLIGPIASLGFAREGSMLVIAGGDGTVRTWDVETQSIRDVIWQGVSTTQFGMWVDDANDSVWVATADRRIISLPLDFDSLLATACAVVGRDLTQAEWDRYVPGGDLVQSACD